MSNLKEFTKGLIKENPNMVMLLGMCPTLAITTMAANGVGRDFPQRLYLYVQI